MTTLALLDFSGPDRSNVIDLFARKPRSQPANESPLAQQLRVRDAVLAECKRRNLTGPMTDSALVTANGTLAFMGDADRAIAAGKQRAADLANGKVRLPTMRPISPADDNGPRAA